MSKEKKIVSVKVSFEQRKKKYVLRRFFFVDSKSGVDFVWLVSAKYLIIIKVMLRAEDLVSVLEGKLDSFLRKSLLRP